MRRLARSIRVLVAAVVSVLVAILYVLTADAAAADDVPYKDAEATGYITFYDKANAPVTSGSLADRPFVWRAVGSVAAPSPYDGDGRKATLLAYTPVQGADPEAWSGNQLTSSTAYADPSHPVAQSEDADASLQDFVELLPPQWDGYIEVRMFYGVPDQPTLNSGYAATDIQVTGTSWKVVRSGPPVDEANPPAPVAGAGDTAGAPSGGPASSAPDGSAGSSPGGPSTPAASAGRGGAGSSGAPTSSPDASMLSAGLPRASNASQGGGSSSAWLITGIVAGVAIIGLSVFALIARRRRSAPGHGS